MRNTLAAELRLPSLPRGSPGKAPLPLLPAGAEVSASTLSNPMSLVFYLRHLSPSQEVKSLPRQLPTAPGYQAAGLTLY